MLGASCLCPADCFYGVATHASIAVKMSLGLTPPRAAGTAFLSHTLLSGRYVIRCALGGTLTQGCHVEAAWRTVQRCADALLAA